MTEPNRKPVCMGGANTPAMPHLADQASQELARPIKAVDDSLRAIQAWFAQHGDPFIPLKPEAFTAEVASRREILDRTNDALGNADLIAQFASAFQTFNARLYRAWQREDQA